MSTYRGPLRAAIILFAPVWTLLAQTNVPIGAERLHAIQERLGEVQSVQADFEQEKQLSLFNQKVILVGRVYIENPSRFAWHAEKPVRYRFRINGDDVRQWDEDTRREQRVPTSNPILKMATGQMRDWFVGRFDGILKDYEAAVTGPDARTFRFVPKPGTLAAKAIRAVEVTPRSDMPCLEVLRIEDLNGDTTTVRFKNPILNQPIAPQAWEVTPRD